MKLFFKIRTICTQFINKVNTNEANYITLKQTGYLNTSIVLICILIKLKTESRIRKQISGLGLNHFLGGGQ